MLPAIKMKVLLLDNYDSYTYNLYDLIARVCSELPVVVRADVPYEEIEKIIEQNGVDCIVISPGPGSPAIAKDIGSVLTVLEKSELPILGVCLGLQALAHVNGSQVIPASVPRHGFVSDIVLTEVARKSDLWVGFPNKFKAVRYHSLAVSDIPECLRVEAITNDDDAVMALSHKTKPQFGVQFHPESIMSQEGYRLIHNFARISFEIKHRDENLLNPFINCPTPFAREQAPINPVRDPTAAASSSARSSATASSVFGSWIEHLTDCEFGKWQLHRKTIDTKLEAIDVWEHAFYDPQLPSAFLDS